MYYSTDEERIKDLEWKIRKLEREINMEETITFIDKDGIEYELYDADPDCNHELDPHCLDGIRCLKCGGWFCY